MNQKMEGRNLTTIYVPDKLKIKEYMKKLDAERKRELLEEMEQENEEGGSAESDEPVDTVSEPS
jgi:hypothetical protein